MNVIYELHTAHNAGKQKPLNGTPGNSKANLTRKFSFTVKKVIPVNRDDRKCLKNFGAMVLNGQKSLNNKYLNAMHRLFYNTVYISPIQLIQISFYLYRTYLNVQL